MWKYRSTHFQIEVQRNNDNATEKRSAITQRHTHVSIHIFILYKKDTVRTHLSL